MSTIQFDDLVKISNQSSSTPTLLFGNYRIDGTSEARIDSMQLVQNGTFELKFYAQTLSTRWSVSILNSQNNGKRLYGYVVDKNFRVDDIVYVNGQIPDDGTTNVLVPAPNLDNISQGENTLLVNITDGSDNFSKVISISLNGIAILNNIAITSTNDINEFKLAFGFYSSDILFKELETNAQILSYREWTNPPPDLTNMANFRAFVKDLHDNITALGTGVTHLSTLPNQFDFASETISKVTGKLDGVAQSKPLYYKYSPNNGMKDVYIAMSFHFLQSGTYTPVMTTRSGVWDSQAEMLSSATYLQPQSTTRHAWRWNIYNRYAINYNHTPIQGKSYIINNNGTLMICSNLGYKNSTETYEFSRPIMFIFVEPTEDGYKRLSHYHGNDNSFNYVNSAHTINADKHSPTFDVLKNKSIMTYYTRECMFLNSKFIDFIQCRTSTHDSEIVPINNLYYYNKNVIGGDGFVDIDGKKVFLSGNKMRGWNFGNNDLIAIAVKAE